MSAQSFEVVLAKLYTDPSFRKSFLDNPAEALAHSDLTESERNDLIAIDKSGLLLTSHSFYHKRKKRLSSRSMVGKSMTFFRKILWN